MELGSSLPHSQKSTTCPYPSQIIPFLCPSHFWQAQLVSFLVGLRTYQPRGVRQASCSKLRCDADSPDSGFTCFIPPPQTNAWTLRQSRPWLRLATPFRNSHSPFTNILSFGNSVLKRTVIKVTQCLALAPLFGSAIWWNVSLTL